MRGKYTLVTIDEFTIRVLVAELRLSEKYDQTTKPTRAKTR